MGEVWRPGDRPRVGRVAQSGRQGQGDQGLGRDGAGPGRAGTVSTLSGRTETASSTGFEQRTHNTQNHDRPRLGPNLERYALIRAYGGVVLLSEPSEGSEGMLRRGGAAGGTSWGGAAIFHFFAIT